MTVRITTASTVDLVVLLVLLPATLLVMLLSVVVLTYLWSSDAHRRRRAREAEDHRTAPDLRRHTRNRLTYNNAAA